MFISPALRQPPYEPVPRFADTGLLFCSIAGLLNMLVVLDLVDRMRGYKKTATA